jgi:quinol monooxygenase YgiN
MYIHYTEHRIHKRHEKAFISAVVALCKASVEEEPGCMRLDFFRDRNEPDLFRLCQVYTGHAAFKAHATTEHARALARHPDWKKWHAGRTPLVIRARNMFPSDADFRRAKKLPLSSKPRGDQRYVHWGIWPLKPRHRAAWVKATSKNARASARTEWGCYRFDVLQDLDDRNRFYLYQLYYDQWFHDEIHANKIHVGRLKADPGYIMWPDRKARPPLGHGSPSGLSHTVRGTVIWTNERMDKPGSPPARPR